MSKYSLRYPRARLSPAKQELAIIEFPRSDIEAGNTQTTLAMLAPMAASSEKAERFEGALTFYFSGWDEDPRETAGWRGDGAIVGRGNGVVREEQATTLIGRPFPMLGERAALSGAKERMENEGIVVVPLLRHNSPKDSLRHRKPGASLNGDHRIRLIFGASRT